MIENINQPEFETLCRQIGEDCKALHASGAAWPGRQLDRMEKAGVYRWFLPIEQGGAGWSNHDLTIAYLKMSQACLASTFVLTQRIAALKRIAVSPNSDLVNRLLPSLMSGESPATVGISHLTTSRRHLSKPILAASPVDGGFSLSGMCPWVTGANAAASVLVGAVVLDDAGDEATENQVLAVVAVDQPGVKIDAGFEMIALTETHTGRVHLDEVIVPDGDLVAGPIENALASLTAAPSTGSFQSSALALGVAAAAIDFLLGEASKRSDLQIGHAALQASHDQTTTALLEAAKGNPACSNEQLRAEANSLVLRATQAAMVAAKGAGFTKGHPVGRWCQEAMFFLVWSCPQSVQDSNLCELAGVEIESA